MNPLLAAVQWKEVFLPSVSIIETLVRGTVVYLVIVVLLRFVLRREAGTLAVTDVLMIVLLGDASQNAMASDHKSICDGLILVATILFWDFTLDWLNFHIPVLQKLVHPKAVPLIKTGKMLVRNMRRELITREEMMSEVRHHGIEKIDDVKAAYMEGDGRITVIPYEQKGDGSEEKQRAV